MGTWDRHLIPEGAARMAHVSEDEAGVANLHLRFLESPSATYAFCRSSNLATWTCLEAWKTAQPTESRSTIGGRWSELDAVLPSMETNFYRILERREIDSDPVTDFGKASLTVWPKGAAAALSLSFDDGYRSHSDVVAPLLESRAMRGTFYVNPGWISAGWTISWENARALVRSGHEVGSHTMTHPHLDEVPLGDATTPGTAIFEVAEARRLLDRHVYEPANVAVGTFGYPFADPGIPAIRDAVVALHGAARGSYGTHNRPGNIDFGSLRAKAVAFAGARGPDEDRGVLQAIQQELDGVVSRAQGWSILLFHDVEASYEGVSGALSAAEPWFEELIDWIGDRQETNRLWVGTVAAVADYVRRRDRASVVTTFVNGDRIETALFRGGVLSEATSDVGLWVEVEVDRDWGGTVLLKRGHDRSLWPVDLSARKALVRFPMVKAMGDLAVIEAIRDESHAD